MNAVINMEVYLGDGYTGDWKSAIDVARKVAIKNEVPVKLTYARQISFLINPNSTDEEIEQMKQRKFSIGL